MKLCITRCFSFSHGDCDLFHALWRLYGRRLTCRERGALQGEEYKLFWPEQPEFVRVASRFGAKIIPFGVVGEDDICDVRSISTQLFLLPPCYMIHQWFYSETYITQLLKRFKYVSF